jgi:oligopeptide/dipeptide ABC transporter ATP-binding protein
MSEALLRVEDLRTYFFMKRYTVKAVDGVSFHVNKGEVLGIVGESGCGKSATALSIMRLISYPGRIVGGKILFKGRDLLSLDERKMREIRGREIGMIFQDPHNSLDPVYNVGWQLMEAIKLHSEEKTPKEKLLDKILGILRKVGIPSPKDRHGDYPHQFSGGQKQRIMIGMSISNIPDLIIADEPTTALDVTVQAQIIDLLRGLQREYGVSIILITHNLGLVAEICNRVAIMYAGKIVEYGDVEKIFYEPLHPYTKLLLKSIPRVDSDTSRLEPIPGSVEGAYDILRGCRFYPRCPEAMEICKERNPTLYKREGHMVLCHLYGGEEDG